MKLRLRRTSQARGDIVRLYRYIGADNPDAAERVLEAIERSLRAIAATPGMGRQWESNDPRFEALRVYPVNPYRNYLIFYRVVGRDVHIFRIVHGSQELGRIVDEIDLETDE